MNKRQGYVKLNIPLYLRNIYYINLDERTDKNKLISDQLNELQFKYTRISAIKGSEIPFKNIYMFGKTLCKKSLRSLPICDICGLYGKILSYKLAITHVLKNSKNVKELCIFEDDSLFHLNFKNLYNFYIDFIPNDWEIILLGCISLEKIQINPYISKVFKFNGTHAIILRNSLFKILKNLCDQPYNSLNVMLSDLSLKHNIYTFTNELVVQRLIKNDTDGEITSPYNKVDLYNFEE